MDGALHGVDMDTLFMCFARRRKNFSVLLIWGQEKRAAAEPLMCF